MSGIVLSFVGVAKAGGVVVVDAGGFSGGPIFSTSFGG